MHSKNWKVCCSVFLTAACAVTALAAPGTISVTLSTNGVPVSTVTTGETFTVTLSISGYTDTNEIDSYSFRVSYDSAYFSYNGSLTHGAAGVQWLSLTNQTLDPNYSPASGSDGSVAGTVSISLSDLSLIDSPNRGTRADSGFLVSFSLLATAVTPGPSSITPTTPGFGPLFVDTAFAADPGGLPSFIGAPMTVVPEPAPLALLVCGMILLAGLRVRRAPRP